MTGHEESPIKLFTADDPEARSADLLAGNIEQLKSLFPEAFTEGKIDFEVLRQLLGGTVEEREEKYGLNWHGKRKARQLALTPSTGTLRPCPEESVEWDSTQHLMIEGDNLEVLKLLQKSYSGKVKLIYIDPPYNTGKDFVYPDNFRDNIENYLELTGQVEGGRKISSNTEASGRFHTDWLNMMYPRLKLARNLLRDDGVILVSSDEMEADNLKNICDDIFGFENFVERIVWKNKYGSGALTKGFANVHEYIIVYSKEPIQDISAPLDDEQRAAYRLQDEKFEYRGGYLTQPLATTSKDPRPNLVYPIFYNGQEIWPEKQWVWAKERFEEAYKNNEIVINESEGKFSVRTKQYLRDENGIERLGKPLSIMNGPFNQEGTRDIATLFPEKIFSFPKPMALLKYFVALIFNGDKSKEGIYLDFFAGSGTTGHAVMAQNAIDGGTRRYILVQLPEPLDPENKDQKVAANFCDQHGKPRTIAEITKERLRRAAKKIKEENPRFHGDLGFRVFKLDSSNIRTWEPDPHDLEASLFNSIEHLKADRSEADILYELLLKLGLDLCVPVEKRTFAGKAVHSVGGGVLLVCLATLVTREEVEPLAQGIVAWHGELAPARDTTCVFRDSAFADDVAKTNLAAILQQHGLEIIRSL
ncbi:site-specific DNA-methyltransferase [Chlorobaculum sp. 24CR]|uniref:site-specific DNA-methyltransferase n=1 Tax=Chlorobaculum sp. 24CR TaxID=2508878 RepID=UPI001ADB9849|nr:site-specific DNA-methyltransferase [Chlorobaculum sp. 24CR]